jgi:hypothetical protein
MRDMIRVKVNKALPGYRVGQVVNVESSPEGTPLSEFWRRRLKDAEIDNCCEVVERELERELVIEIDDPDDERSEES